VRRLRLAADLLRTRSVIVLLVGVALAASLTFGFVPTVFRAYAQRRVVRYDPRLLDLVSLALNAALLVALVCVGHLHRDAPEPNE
jgi:hypothetical protein